MFCKNCGKELQENWAVCPKCGQAIASKGNSNSVPSVGNSSMVYSETGKKGFWSTGRLVLGIISCIACVAVLFQSCAVGMFNTLADTGGVDGSAGFVLAVCILVAGIVGICTRNSRKKAGPVVSCIFYWIGAVFSLAGSGFYGDLPIWGALSFICGCVFLVAAIKTK